MRAAPIEEAYRGKYLADISLVGSLTGMIVCSLGQVNNGRACLDRQAVCQKRGLSARFVP